MVSIGSAVFYRPKDKQVHADNAHKQFSRGAVGDHMMLMNVYNVSGGALLAHLGLCVSPRVVCACVRRKNGRDGGGWGEVVGT